MDNCPDNSGQCFYDTLWLWNDYDVWDSSTYKYVTTKNLMLTEAFISDYSIHIFKTVSTMLHSVLVFHVHLLNTSLWLQSQGTFQV